MENNVISTDFIIQEFDESVVFETHYLEIINDDETETVTISNIKAGYSEGYLADEELDTFENWSTVIEDSYTVPPSSSTGDTIVITIYKPPVVTEVNPSQVLQCGTTTIKLVGMDFSQETDVAFTNSEVTVDSIKFIDEQELEVTISAGKTDPGFLGLLTINPGYRVTFLDEALEIIVLGDVNNDGSVDIVDAFMTAQYYVGLNPPGFNTDVADVNFDESVDIVDALTIAQYYVGIISAFC